MTATVLPTLPMPQVHADDGSTHDKDKCHVYCSECDRNFCGTKAVNDVIDHGEWELDILFADYCPICKLRMCRKCQEITMNTMLVQGGCPNCGANAPQ